MTSTVGRVVTEPGTEHREPVGTGLLLILTALSVLALSAVTASRAPLMWDGSYYLFRLLDDGTPLVVYNRFPAAVPQFPAWVTWKLTENIELTSFAFAVGYGLVPVLCGVLAWSWHRSDRAAFCWSVIGSTATILPAQVFFVSEAAIAAQLWCPLFLLVVSGRWRERRVSGLAVLVAVIALHPLSAALLVLLAAAVVAGGDRSRSGLGLAVLLVGVGVTRVLTLASYESEGLPGLTQAVSRGGYVNTAAFGLLLASVVLMVLVDRRRSTRLAPLVGLAAAGLAGGLFVVAGLDPEFLYQAPGARFSLVTSGVVFAVLVVWHRRCGRAPADRRLALAAALSVAISSLYMAVAGIGWQELVKQRIDPLLAGSQRCVDVHAQPDLYATPLDTWSTSALSIIRQGRAPTHLILAYDQCAALAVDKPIVLLDKSHGKPRERTGGWFDLSRAGLPR